MNETRAGNLTGFESTSQDGLLILGSCYFVESLLVMVANGVVFIVIVKTRELQLPTLWIIEHMAVWDFLHGLHVFIFAMPSAFLNRFAFPRGFMGVSVCMTNLIMSQTVLNTAMMVVDRYIAVKWPMRYISIATKRNYVIATLASLLLSTCRVLLIIFPHKKFHYDSFIAICMIYQVTALGALTSGIIIIIAFIIIAFCTLMMFIEILRSRRRIHSFNSTGAPSESVAKFAITVTSTAGVFLLSHLPFLIAVARKFIIGTEHASDVLLRLVPISLLANSILNVFIYTGTYRPFRESLTSVFCKAYYRRQRRSDMNITLGKSSLCLQTNQCVTVSR